MQKLIPEIVRGIIVFILPYFAGLLVKSKSASFSYLAGQLLLWAAFQVVAVPVVLFRADFSALFWIYAAIVAALTGFGIRARHRDRLNRNVAVKRSAWYKRLSPFLVIALLVIGYQMFVYIFGMHLDEDDARWIAEANDALAKNKMFIYNPATGEYIGWFQGEMLKDVFSPWSMYLAWLSRATGIKTAVIAHTVYPPILLGLSYSAYYEIGCQLFRGEKKVHERGIFLLMVSVINLFFAGNVYTQSVFALTRIWQGKAVVAAVMIPTIAMVFLRIQKPRRRRSKARKGNRVMFGSMPDWILLIVAGTCCCLFSGMGISIGFYIIVVYGAWVAVQMIIATALGKSDGWRGCAARIGLLIAAVLPSIVYSLGALWLRGQLYI